MDSSFFQRGKSSPCRTVQDCSLNHANFGLVNVGNIPLIGLSKIGASSVNLSVVMIHHFELSSFLTKGHFVLLLRKLKLIFHRKP